MLYHWFFSPFLSLDWNDLVFKNKMRTHFSILWNLSLACERFSLSSSLYFFFHSSPLQGTKQSLLQRRMEHSRVEMKMAKKGVCNWVKVAWCYKFNLIDRFIILYGNNPLMKVQIRYYRVSQQVLDFKFLQNLNFETCQKNSSNRWEICTV